MGSFSGSGSLALVWAKLGSNCGTITAAATVMESTSTASTASSGTLFFFFSFLPFLEVSLELSLEKKLGMLTGKVGNLMRGVATSEDFSTPLKTTDGLYLEVLLTEGLGLGLASDLDGILLFWISGLGLGMGSTLGSGTTFGGDVLTMIGTSGLLGGVGESVITIGHNACIPL